MILAHPTEHVRRSTSTHNSDLTVVADWLELSCLLFDDDREGWTIPECADYLIDQRIYDDQDFCAEFLESVFSELRVRQQLRGPAYPLQLGSTGRLLSTAPWTEAPALTFCLQLSLLPYYSGYTRWVNGDYVEQGRLFEVVTEDAFSVWFPEWEVLRTGWSGGGGAVSVLDLLDLIGRATVEAVRAEAETFISTEEKDLGMDIAAVRMFADGRPSLPVIFGQCASGQNWRDKLPTPNASRWKLLLTLTHTPLRAFSMPFRLQDGDYAVRRGQFQGLLMDRFRLLPPVAESSWLTAEAQDDLCAWVETRRGWLETNYFGESAI